MPFPWRFEDELEGDLHHLMYDSLVWFLVVLLSEGKSGEDKMSLRVTMYRTNEMEALLILPGQQSEVTRWS